jgi:hypothetical protein
MPVPREMREQTPDHVGILSLVGTQVAPFCHGPLAVLVVHNGGVSRSRQRCNGAKTEGNGRWKREDESWGSKRWERGGALVNLSKLLWLKGPISLPSSRLCDYLSQQVSSCLQFSVS